MSLSKEALKKYAELGVRERLREIQRELDTLARDFPHLVHNADGSMPSVIPIVVTKTALDAATLAPRNNAHDRQQQAAAYLATHPGATAQAVASAIGIRMSGTVRDHILKPIATATGRGTSADPKRWTLKARNGSNGHHHAAPIVRGSKLRQRRQASADLLAKFNTTTPRTMNAGIGKLGILVQTGYLAKKDDGYIRTAKPYHVNKPREATA